MKKKDLIDIFIYQIFYDEKTREKIAPGFIPLDNTNDTRPDWYEFWPIRNFLNNTELDNDAWYGFLSPKFEEKSGFNSTTILEVLRHHAFNSDVAIFSSAWDQLSYFLNPFEQGEIWHPGLLSLSQVFFNQIGFEINLKNLVTYTSTSVFSNYIIAKKNYWIKWLDLANKFYDIVENDSIPNISGKTSYGSNLNQTPMKTFIQERFASVILSQGGYNVLSFDKSQTTPIFKRLFKDDLTTRKLLQTCDLMKERYVSTRDVEYLNMYYKIRKEIDFTMPTM